jgi:hypothetical protein
MPTLEFGSAAPVAVCGLCWIVNRSKSRLGLKPCNSIVAWSLRLPRFAVTVTVGAGELGFGFMQLRNDCWGNIENCLSDTLALAAAAIPIELNNARAATPANTRARIETACTRDSFG